VKQTRDNIDSHDWDARASEALANAKKLPPGSKRTEAIRKAGQLRIRHEKLADGERASGVMQVAGAYSRRSSLTHRSSGTTAGCRIM
jgi:hypothetical protein